ncbi:NADP-dependent malic enzyme [Candidatus Microgenomates bacterium]|nr:NADP-dependent malic enzyme [Candidatus Microgenomates bacterium]
MQANDLDKQAIDLHKKYQGKLETTAKVGVTNRKELSLAYTPGVAAVCKEIQYDKHLENELTLKGRTIAVVTDGSAVLGLGNIGPEAAMPVMEGKALLFKTFGGIDAFPICLATQETQKIIEIVKNLAPTFAGINLEDISAPRCFEIEESLQDIGIPVMHDDQAGAAIVTLAGLLNAAKVVGKPLKEMKVVISGAGAAGIAIARMVLCLSFEQGMCTPVKDLIMVDSQGIILENSNKYKAEIAKHSNKEKITGGLREALKGADVFIGVSKGNILTADAIALMNKNPIVFAMANPVPEIMPEEAKKGGAAIVATGRSDYPNQINNLLAFPGIFKGVVGVGAEKITNRMKLAAALKLASLVPNPTFDKIIPSVFEKGLAEEVARVVAEAV